MKTLFDLISAYIISGVAGNTAYDIIRIALDKANQRSWEDLYLDAFQLAVQDLKPHFMTHLDGGEVMLDKRILSRILHYELEVPMDDISIGKLDNDIFIGELSRAMELQELLVIGGHNLSRVDYSQLIRNLIHHAHDLFREAIIKNEPAFRRALFEETLGNRSLATEILGSLSNKFGFTLSKLDVIEHKINDQSELIRQLASSKPPRDNPGLAEVQQHLTVPRQVRVPVGDFVGRKHAINQAVAALNRIPGENDADPVIVVIRGMPGVGKTELAYTIVQKALPNYFGAHLFIDLRGSRENPLSIEQALQTLIRSLNPMVPMPENMDGLEALYRSLLHDSHSLVLADDAIGAVQVSPLLPPAGCGLLVTSRLRFSIPGMTAIDLESLSQDQAEQLLYHISPRIGRAAPRMAQLCGRLPLALRVSASILANDATVDVEDYLERLDYERFRLHNLRDPDDYNLNVEASFGQSFENLSSEAQITFCRLSIFPSSFDSNAAVEVADISDDFDNRDATGSGILGNLLGLLHRRSLLDYDYRTKRYSMHDLVRIFAVTRLQDDDPVRLRHANHYVNIARQTWDQYWKGGTQLIEALAVFNREEANIESALSWLRMQPPSPEVDRLLVRYVLVTVILDSFSKSRERVQILEHALAAARRLEAKSLEGAVLHMLGMAYYARSEASLSLSCYEQHLKLERELGNRHGECIAIMGIGTASEALGDIRRAIDLFEQALAIATECDDKDAIAGALSRIGLAHYHLGDATQAVTFHAQHLALEDERAFLPGQGIALGNLGLSYMELDDIERASTYFRRQLEMAREVGDRENEGAALGNLGLVCYKAGNCRQAIEYHQQQLAIMREIGNRRGEGNALGHIGIAYHQEGQIEEAIDSYEQHLDVTRKIGDRRAEAITSWNLGLLLIDRGDVLRALELIQISVDFNQAVGHVDVLEFASELKQMQDLLQRIRDNEPYILHILDRAEMATRRVITSVDATERQALIEKLEVAADTFAAGQPETSLLAVLASRLRALSLQLQRKCQ